MDTIHPLQQDVQDVSVPAMVADGGDWIPVRIDLLGIAARVALQWRVISLTTAFFLFVSALVAIFSTPYYEGEASFMPPAREISPFGFSGGLSASSVLAVSGLGFGPGGTYLGLLRSRSVQDSVAQQLNVQAVYHLKNTEAARTFVGGKAKFDVQTNGIITVTCRDKSPQFAAQLANAYLQALYKLNQRMSAASVSQRGEFYDQEVVRARESLEKSEANLINTQQRVGILEPNSTTQIAITTEARLQASIQSSEVQLAILRQSQTDSSPEVTRLLSQISQLRAQLAQQQSSVSGVNHRGGGEANGTLPQQSLESVRSVRDVREREAIYEALLRQADVTRFSESDPGPQLQIIDSAVVPLQKAGPSRRFIVLAGTLTGFLLSVLYTLSGGFFVRNYARLKNRMRAVKSA